jgi:hypothetical protein
MHGFGDNLEVVVNAQRDKIKTQRQKLARLNSLLQQANQVGVHASFHVVNVIMFSSAFG